MDFWKKTGYHNKEAFRKEQRIRWHVSNNRIDPNIPELVELWDVS